MVLAITFNLKIPTIKKKGERRSLYSICSQVDCFYELLGLRFHYKESSVPDFTDQRLPKNTHRTQLWQA